MKQLLSIFAFVAVVGLAPLDAAVRPPRLEYELMTLPNGLTIVLSPDHSTPIVQVELWYHVGSKDEKAGRTGFAHLFEHMMFKGSKNVEPEEHASILASVGGLSNAYTNDDATVFWQTVPSQYLPLALWMEADRMATLRIDKATFENEREVVKEERRLRVDNQPFGRLSEILYDNFYTVSPYKHTTIGSMKDLDSASVEDVRDFHRSFYVPENATIAIVGDFDMAQAKELVTRYFGRVPKSGRVIPREYPREKPSTAERRVIVNENWPLPAVIVAYPITYDGHPDSYPLHLTSKILSDGESSRIYRSLVYEKQIALSAFGSGNIIEEPNLFFAVALVAPGRTHDEVEKALIAEFDNLRTSPITERELQRAKNQFFRDYIVDRESIRGKASQLAHAVVIHRDVTTADGEVEIFTNMKVSDLQRVAKTYFTPESRMVLKILPKAPGGR
ncbi:MAG TPA: pitrilysin family protein [Vicinamibacterales bacterium]|nr:pitrilysin family protein [Vicinamibacterales bacterium]